MIVEKKKVWNDKRRASYTMYLLDNSAEVDSGRMHPAVVICGGGGFMRITEREKQPVAMYFLSKGYQVFTLDYITKATGLACYPEPVTDLAKLMLIIRTNSEKWKINQDSITVIGFSAGGQVCASLATQWDDNLILNQLEPGIDPEKIRPNAVVLCYPMLDYLYQIERSISEPEINPFSPSIGMKKKDFLEMFLEAGVGVDATEEQYKKASPYYYVSEKTPPIFLWHTSKDELVYAEQSLRFAERLSVFHIPYEIHVFEEGFHGLALANENSTCNPELINEDVTIWADLALKFLKRHNC
ncbi:alpha/beta hydrolase [Kineothrix sedimenti]|uniref:Alpha/beta hydrolase n=1 Tax=Kineothrix sedimenti TaxID=3123317 RepID=A0ABZ3EYS9_9FIRM